MAGRGGRALASASPTPQLGALGLGVALVAVMLATQLAGAIVVRSKDVDPEQYLYVYDLAALSARDGENLLPPEVASERGMAPIDSRFSVDSMVYLVHVYDPPVVPAPLAPGPAAALRDEWLDQVTGDPGEYLAARAELFGRQLALTRSARYVLIPNVLGNPYGYAVWFGGFNSAALDYLKPFTEPETEPENPFFSLINGGPLYAVWVYLLVAAAAALVLLRRQRTLPERAVGALALAALTLQLGLFILAMGTEYRFEFPAVAAAMLAGAVALRTLARPGAGQGSPGRSREAQNLHQRL